jgi:hypothetical protein
MQAPSATDTGIGTATVDPVAPEPPRADRLAEVLLPELVRILAGEGEPGTVLGGRPHLRLFGEPIDLALPLRALRRLGEAASGMSVCIDEDTLSLHGRATAEADGYWVSAAGMVPARRRGSGRDAGVPADAMSLRLQTSSFGYAINALLRADPAAPCSGSSGAATCLPSTRSRSGSGGCGPCSRGSCGSRIHDCRGCSASCSCTR